MAERRMFAKTIIDSDAFLEMPATSQLLYFHLGMRADDDGFVNKPKSIMRLIGGKEDDMNVLFARKFIIPFESGIVVVKHWKIHNYIRNDRYKPTKYEREKSLLNIKENGAYTLQEKRNYDKRGIPTVNQLPTDCQPTDIPVVGEMDTQVRLGKVRDSIDKDSINTICQELEESAPDSMRILLPLVDGSFYEVPDDKIQNWTAAFPSVDILLELKKMYVWLDGNPKKKKTRRGISRFIVGWLERSQNKGGCGSGKKTNSDFIEELKGWAQNE